MDKVKRIGEKLVYKGHIIDLYEDYLLTPDNNKLSYDLVKCKGGASICPIDSEGNVYLVKQYRNSVDDEVYEIPAGCYDYKGEPGEICAARELEEEIGMKAGNLEYFTNIVTAIGVCDERSKLYFATDLIKGEQNLDPEEYIHIYKFTIEEAIDMIFDGTIIDAKTIVAILGYKEWMKRKGNN